MAAPQPGHATQGVAGYVPTPGAGTINYLNEQ